MGEIIKCKICGSDETVRSFASHLRWKHPDMKTDDYVKQYGEFRPKNLKQAKAAEESGIKCEICDKSVKSYRELAFHLHEHNDITWKEYCIKYNIKLSEDIEPPEFKTCTKCGNSKPIEEFCNKKGERDGHHRYCKECSYKISKTHYHSDRKINKKEYYQGYRNNHKEYMSEYRDNHKDKSREYRRYWDRNKNKTDREHRLKKIISVGIHKALKRFHQTKKDRTINYLGISISEYIIYLENQFTPEMTWENYASYWEIDHIMPIDSFNLTDEKQVYECFNYKNTRPLYWKDNVEKSNKIIPELIVGKYNK